MLLGCLRHARPDIDAIDLDVLHGPAILSRTLQQRAHGLRVVRIGGCEVVLHR